VTFSFTSGIHLAHRCFINRSLRASLLQHHFCFSGVPMESNHSPLDYLTAFGIAFLSGVLFTIGIALGTSKSQSGANDSHDGSNNR
jgi:hypothetical protein